MNHSSSHKNEKLCLNLAAKFENISYKQSISFVVFFLLEAGNFNFKFGQR